MFNYLRTLSQYLFFVFFCFIHYKGKAQNLDQENLRSRLKHTYLLDSTRVNILVNLARETSKINLEESRNYANQANSISRKIHYNVGIAESNQILVFLKLIEKPRSITFLQLSKSLIEFQNIGNLESKIRILLCTSAFYVQENEFDQAISYVDEALSLIKSSAGSVLEPECLCVLGSIYINQKNFTQAIETLNLALSLSIKFKNKSTYYLALNQKAILLMHKGDFTKSISILNKSVDFFIRSGDLLDNYYTRVLLGKACTNNKEYLKAHSNFESCIGISHWYGSNNLLSQSFQNLSKLDSLEGNYKEALTHYNQFLYLQDSLNNKVINRQAYLFETKYIKEKKNDEKEILALQQFKNRLIIRVQFIALFILFIILIGFFILLIKLRKVIAQNKIAIEEVLVKNDQIKTKNSIIEEQRVRQEKINLVKDKLFSVISHDMRTPLTQLQGILSLMEVNALKMSEWTELLPALKRNVQSSTEQLDTLLLWSKNQMQGFQTHISQFLICRLTEKNYEVLKPSFEEKNIQFFNEVSPDLMVEADQEMIQIVLRNLLSNAIKFTSKNGNITVSSQVKDTHVFIHIKDTGVGIHSNDFEKIFAEIDYSTPGTLGEKGTGLGLKLSKDFLEMNQGNIYVESEIGIGSTFIFSIPIAQQRKYNFSKEVR